MDLDPKPTRVLLAVLIAWNAYGISRLAFPLRAGHEAFIGRQIGRTGRNHLALGLGVTKGTTVVDVDREGTSLLHRSYSPLASWTSALPMAAGLDFDLSVRLPVLISSNFFLAGLWWLAASRWGTRPADLALLFASTFPVYLFRYGLTCIFEILALGPLMVALALLARPSRGPRRCALIASAGVAAVMYSWICWIALVPGVLAEFRAGRRRAAIAIGAAILVVPPGVHFWLASRVSGDIVGDVLILFRHILVRSSQSRVGLPDVTLGEMLRLDLKRLHRGIGLIPLALSVGSLAVAATRRRVGASGVVLALLVMALPLNLAPNIASLHDFFVILFVPGLALASGLGTWWLAGRLGGERHRVAAAVGIFAAFVALDVVPRYKGAAASAKDYFQDRVARAVGEAVDEGDFVIVNPAACELDAASVASRVPPDRQMHPLPHYFGETSQTIFVATDTEDAARLARSAGPGARVVLVEIGPRRFDLPPGFEPAASRTTDVLIGVRPPEVAASPATDPARRR